MHMLQLGYCSAPAAPVIGQIYSATWLQALLEHSTSHLTAAAHPAVVCQGSAMQHSPAIHASCLLQAFVEALHPGERDATILQQHGLLQCSVMAHGTCLRDHELSSMASAGAAIADCPLFNFFFGDEILAVRDVLAHGVAVGLGTDIAGGERCLSSTCRPAGSTAVVCCVLHRGAVTGLRTTVANQ